MRCQPSVACPMQRPRKTVSATFVIIILCEGSAMLSIFDSRFCSATRVASGQLGGVPAASRCLGARRAALFWPLRGRTRLCDPIGITSSSSLLHASDRISRYTLLLHPRIWCDNRAGSPFFSQNCRNETCENLEAARHGARRCATLKVQKVLVRRSRLTRLQTHGRRRLAADGRSHR